MDAVFIFWRVLHIVAAMIWFGGAIVSGFFLQPTAQALGPTGQPFMEHLMRRRRLGIMFPIVAALTVVSGAVLYWYNSAGLQLAWIISPTGLAFTIGGLAALAAFVGGMVFIGPSVADQTAVARELAAGNGVADERQRERLERADRRLKLASRVDLPLLIVAALTMAVARYLA
ncbi:MAG: hypothetical protein KY456_01055 [Chloroflexi bacterium]|nr:hypothetical protein [Chloroflexota bacterium]